ncbi:MAG: hypothetical protein CM15mV40_120 [Caudoviricetes sp.]|nr:MAG: hypothetical protein CM15mV40_120 [Caudoviricetes sp.]
MFYSFSFSFCAKSSLLAHQKFRFRSKSRALPHQFLRCFPSTGRNNFVSRLYIHRSNITVLIYLAWSYGKYLALRRLFSSRVGKNNTASAGGFSLPNDAQLLCRAKVECSSVTIPQNVQQCGTLFLSHRQRGAGPTPPR